MLALAYASTVASGATFLGVPGLAYTYGLSAVILLMIYPVGVYSGLWLAQKMISSYGNRHGARSIAEYLGLRYRSEALRIMVALFSLILLTYLAGQLVAGLVMFEMFLGLAELPALVIRKGGAIPKSKHRKVPPTINGKRGGPPLPQHVRRSPLHCHICNRKLVPR